MLLLPPSAFSLSNDHDNRSITVHEQLEQLQMEMGRLRTNNEALKTSGRGKKKRFISFRFTFFSSFRFV